MFQVNPLLGRRFTRKIKPYFFSKDKSKKLKCHLLQFLFGALRVKREKSHISPIFSGVSVSPSATTMSLMVQMNHFNYMGRPILLCVWVWEMGRCEDPIQLN